MTLIMHVILIISVRAVSSNGIRIGLPRTLTMVSSAAILIVLLAIAQAAAQTVDKAKHMIEGVRDARYCEIIPVVRHGLRFVGTVYNTLGLNDSPPAGGISAYQVIAGSGAHLSFARFTFVYRPKG